MNKRLAVLTDEECKAWDYAFEFYADNGWTDKEISEKAWNDLQVQFPRLRDYEGALP